MIELETLKACFPQTDPQRVAYFHEGICQTFEIYEINNPRRQAAFLAQCGHESGGLRLTEENLNYKAEALTRLWPKRFPPDVAARYARNPEMIANRAYCDRMGNGPESSGEGWAYRGRGLIQLTGKANYIACSDALGIDLVSEPDLVAQNPVAVLSAGWFWDRNGLNALADAEDILAMTKRINGGTIGLEDRKKHYEHMKHVLGE